MSNDAFTVEAVRRGSAGRRILLPLMLLAVVAVCLPAICGLAAESLIRRQISQINELSPVRIDLTYYQRGWFDSTMLSRISVPTLGIDANLSHRINHGPLSLHVLQQQATIHIAEVFTQPVFARLDNSTVNANDLLLATKIGFFGDVVTSLAPVSGLPSPHQQNRVVFSTGRADAGSKWQPAAVRFNAWAESDRLSFSGPGYLAELNEVYARTDTSVAGTTNILQSHFEAANVDYLQNGRRSNAKSIWLQVTSEFNGDTTTTHFTGSAKSFSVGNEILEDLSFDATLRVPSMPVNTETSVGSEFVEGDSRRKSPIGASLEKQTAALLHLLPHNSQLDVSRMVFTNRQRDVHVRIEARKLTQAIGEDSAKTAGMMNDVNVRVELSADRSLVFDVLEHRTREVINRSREFGEMDTFTDLEAAPLVKNSVQSQLDILERQGYLDVRNGYYTTRLSLLDGHLSINDKPLLLRSFMR